MNIFILCIRSFLIIPFLLLLNNISVYSQVVPMQEQIVSDGALRYFRNLPIKGWENLLHLMKMGSFDLMLNQHYSAKERSPFRIFNFSSNRRLPNKQWSLSFKNNEKYYRGIMKLQFGLCAGLTIVTRKLQMLAIFDPNNKSQQVLPHFKSSDDWFVFMKNKIDDVLTNNKMTIIPFFRNTLELSENPKLKRYLKEHVIRQWELANINFMQGIYQGYLGTMRRMNYHTSLSNIQNMRKILNLGINPIMIMPAPDSKLLSTEKWIHVVQVVDIIRNKNAYTIKVWDPNLENPEESEDVNVFYNGKIFFGERELAGIYHFLWDEYEIAEMVDKNLQFCIDRPGFCTSIPMRRSVKLSKKASNIPQYIKMPISSL